MQRDFVKSGGTVSFIICCAWKTCSNIYPETKLRKALLRHSQNMSQKQAAPIPSIIAFLAEKQPV